MLGMPEFGTKAARYVTKLLNFGMSLTRAAAQSQDLATAALLSTSGRIRIEYARCTGQVILPRTRR
jgi:hypothetical protein